MVDFGLGLRVAKIKHKNHLQLLRQAAVTQVTSRQSYKEGNMVLLGPGYHVTASLPMVAQRCLSTGIGSQATRGNLEMVPQKRLQKIYR